MESDMRLIMGLGNPGAKYRNNRHNIGFMVLDELARRLSANFQPMGPSHLLALGRSASGEMVHLVKPLTYMNLSGEALLRWSEKEQIPLTADFLTDPGEIVTAGEIDPTSTPVEPTPAGAREVLRPMVVCDDLALPLGSLRLRASGSSGGQNGLASIIECLGGEYFPRLRLGVAGGSGQIPPEIWPDYVLADFPRQEAEAANELVNYATDALQWWLAHGLAKTISRFNRRPRPE